MAFPLIKFRFTLCDLFILITAFAVGFWVFRGRSPFVVSMIPVGLVAFPILWALVRTRGWPKLCPLIPAPFLLLFALLLVSSEGRQQYFSPHTLEVRTDYERLLPGTSVPVLVLDQQRHLPDLAEYLIAQGYWKPQKVKNPKWYRWCSSIDWNIQWHGDSIFLYSDLHTRHSWSDWTEENPELAAVVWPLVLQALRQEEHGLEEAETVLYCARVAESEQEFWDYMESDSLARQLIMLR